MISDPIGESSGRWVELVQKIMQGDEDGVEELYLFLYDVVRANLSQTVDPQSIEDTIQEVLVIVIEAIRSGGVREPARLLGFIKTVAQRRAVAHIRYSILRRHRFVTADLPEPQAPLRDSPDTGLARYEGGGRARKVLQRLSVRDREILERFYLREQPYAQ